MKATDKVTVTISAETLKMLVGFLNGSEEQRDLYWHEHDIDYKTEPRQSYAAWEIAAKEAGRVFGVGHDDVLISHKFDDDNTIPLNDDYSAEILDGKVKVGCQEFSFDAIKKLHKAIKKL